MTPMEIITTMLVSLLEMYDAIGGKAVDAQDVIAKLKADSAQIDADVAADEADEAAKLAASIIGKA